MKNQIPSVLSFALAAALMAVPVAPLGAQEQRIIAVVNTDIVSNFDVDSRIALNFATIQGGASPEARERVRPQVLRQLIDERIQVQEAKRLGVTVPKRDIDAQIARLERANNLPAGAVDQILRRHGAASSRAACGRRSKSVRKKSTKRWRAIPRANRSPNICSPKSSCRSTIPTRKAKSSAMPTS